MNNIYFMSEIHQLVLLIFACLLLIGQGEIFCLAYDVHRPQRKTVLTQETLILGFVFLSVLAMTVPVVSLQHGDISLGRYNTARYIVGLLALSSIFWGIQTKITGALLAVTVAISLPYIDNHVFCVLTALVLWGLRIYFVFRRIRELHQEQITSSAIKEAMDYLPIGMLFAYDNGEIFLANVAGLRYMYGCFHRYFGDITALWNASVEYPHSQCLEKKILGKDLFIRLNASCSLLLSLTELATPHGKIRQMLIRNVTEEDHDNLQLTKQNAALKASGVELKNMLKNLEIVTRQQVATQMRFYIHDLMGQRLTLLQQLLYDEKNLDYKKILNILDEVSSDMRTAKVETPDHKLTRILTTYQDIGIDVQVKGTLPEEKNIAETFVAIIREGITNAIRHGHCSRVNVSLLSKEDKYILNIADNGISSAKKLVFGTGLTGITNRLEQINGILETETKPVFTLHCEVKASHD